MADVYSSSRRHKYLTFRDTGLTGAAATTDDLKTIYLDHMTTARVAVTETGNAVNLDAFEIEYKFHEDGEWISVAAAAGDYTTPTSPVIAASGDLASLVKDTAGWVVLDVRGVYAVKFSASGNAGIVTITLEGSVW